MTGTLGTEVLFKEGLGFDSDSVLGFRLSGGDDDDLIVEDFIGEE